MSDSDSSASSRGSHHSLRDSLAQVRKHFHHRHLSKRDKIRARLVKERERQLEEAALNGRAWLQSHARGLEARAPMHLRRDARGNLEGGVRLGSDAPSPPRYILRPQPSIPPPAPVILAPRAMQPSQIRQTPTSAYLSDLSQRSVTGSRLVPKSKLLISDLDNTLYAPLTHVPEGGVVARPFLHTFLDYILHPDSPYVFAVWTFAGEFYGIQHLRSVGEGRIFLDNNVTQPLLADGVAAFWGYEQSGLTASEQARGMSPGVKNLDLMWDMINLHRARGVPEWSSLNSLIIDDQIRNAGAQPDSLIRPPVYRETTDASGIEDDWLLQIIGALDELSHESNFAEAIKERGWNYGIKKGEEGIYMEKGRKVCEEMGIKVRRGKKSRMNLRPLEIISSLRQVGPPNDAVPPPTDRKGRVDVGSLRGCCQDPPHPDAVVQNGPIKEAQGMTDFPDEMYEKICAQPSQLLKNTRKPLICLDLDGTLYSRPPCHIDPMGYPTPRPYLRSFMTYLLSPECPYTVAIWTAGTRATALRCLTDLNLGIVGPKAIDGEVEIRNAKLVAVWVREDLGLSKEDFEAYVKITKDLDMLWEHLDSAGIGKWSACNTVMVDDTPGKLKAQPDTVIAAPTFVCPLGPGPDTTASMEDEFLLQLLGMLDELSHESNFANYISGQFWNKGVPRGRREEFATKGCQVLKDAGVPILAESLGPISSSTQGSRGRSSLAVSTTIYKRRGVPQLTSPPSETSSPLSVDAAPYVFSNKSSGSVHRAGIIPSSPSDDAFSSDDDVRRSSNMRPAVTKKPLDPVDVPPAYRRHPRISSSVLASTPTSVATDTDTDSSDESVDGGVPARHRLRQSVPTFIKEEEELARLHGRAIPRAKTPIERLDFAVDDWRDQVAKNGRQAQTVPVVENNPYEDGWRSYRRKVWNPSEVSQDD